MAGRLCRYVARHRRGGLVRYLAGKADRLLQCYENADNYNFEENGERAVLAKLRGRSISCILDVGANVGDWALIAHACFPASTVHCFEILPSTHEELQRRTRGASGIVTNAFGLSDEPGEVTLRYFPQVSTITTMTDYPHEFEHKTTTGRVETGDRYLADHDIEHVDFLKIDVEGAEPKVLAGFASAFGDRRIDMVQFEYGQVSILTKFLLRDFHSFFEERGFRVGKIYPDHVAFREYAFGHENFLGSNFLAVRTELADVFELLG